MAPQADQKLQSSDSVTKESSGRKEVYFEGYFYDVTDWVKRHPGGRIIEFYTKSGEDATLPIQQFHQRSEKKVKAIMSSLKRRPAELHELGLEPQVLKRHQALTEDFQKLYRDLESEGYFTPSLPHVIYRISELVVLAALGIYLISLKSPILTFFGIISFALFQGRCGWLMHEGGHHSLTGVPNWDRFLQSVIYGLGDGMSSSWWSSQHNRHHAMPQRLKHDVDLQTLPLIAFNSKVVKNPKDGKGFFVQHQSVLFLAIDTLMVATMWKLYLHPRYVIQKGTYTQLLFMALHYTMAYHVGFLNYIITVWLASIYIFGNFSLSHTHLPVTDGPLHWVEYALSHTMDIEPSGWCDWWMAYLNYQIEHHLFPTMPQFRHPLIQGRVRELAKKHNIPYYCDSYANAVMKTYSNLADVSKELRH
ncbi:Fatty acid desaturase 2 [Orchesella cincta]|uniref:Fatty acid desaturase 2 n=1 Tax=Orchesella cincta TaxID=48709 RepID=A0A1D2NDY6_ORCCI|nr:Fatty acid desaturase 2 [Orchesella cincta]